MALLQPGVSAQTLVTYAGEIAKASGYTSQAGDLLNMILGEISQVYNIAQAQSFFKITFTVSALTPVVNSANVVTGSGPYALPNNFLRMDRNDFWWQLGGINYFPTAMSMAEFDALVQQPGFNSYPSAYAIDTSTVPYGLYIWPASSGAYQAFGRYWAQQTDITTPATSSTVPWFPYQLYLQTRLAAELMAFTGDQRRNQFLQDSRDMLRGFLELEGNNSTFAQRVTLDRRRFGNRWQTLPATKAVPW